MKVNTVLHTGGGRKIGNAIIIGNEGKFNLVKTDCGNEVKLTDDEIEELFYPAYSNLSSEELELMRASIGEHKNYIKQ